MLLQLQLPRLDLREVEDVVDEGQQRLTAGPDDAGELLLLLAQRRLQEEARHPDDAVERRADLVAHAGDELALRLRRALGLLLRRSERRLRPLVLGHLLLELGLLPFQALVGGLEVAVGHLQPLHHAVEGAGELADLVPRDGVDPLREVAPGDLAGRLGDPPQRARDDRAHHEDDPDAQEEHGEADPGDTLAGRLDVGSELLQ